MWKHCSKVIHRPGVCHCAVLSGARSMSEAKVHVSVEQHIIIKFLTKEGCKQSEICSRLKRQYGEKTLSNVSVYRWSSEFKKGRETVENEPYERRPKIQHQLRKLTRKWISLVRDLESSRVISVSALNETPQFRHVFLLPSPRNSMTGSAVL